MDGRNDEQEHLPTGHWLSPNKHTNGELTTADSRRPTLDEALVMAARLVACYPNGGANASDAYLLALAAVLVTFSFGDAEAASDPVRGVPSVTRFLPTPADLFEWYESRNKRENTFSSSSKLMDAIEATLARRKCDDVISRQAKREGWQKAKFVPGAQ